jgi:N-6 DNA Methylase/HsdM N-terminal domain
VPPEARWIYLKSMAPQPTIGRLVDDAMGAIERDNPSLKGVLPRDYARPGLDKQRLGQLINLVSDIALGAPADRAKDTLGRVYEYFLSQFASAEGKKGGQFYTPTHVVRVLVEMLAPYAGRVYDHCCGSGGMCVQSENFIRAHATGKGNGGRAKARISIYGQESNYTTWRLAKMNLAIRGIDAQIAHGDSFQGPWRRGVANDCARTGRDSAGKCHHRLDGAGECAGATSCVGEADFAKARLSARQAGEGDANGAGTSGTAFRAVGRLGVVAVYCDRFFDVCHQMTTPLHYGLCVSPSVGRICFVRGEEFPGIPALVFLLWYSCSGIPALVFLLWRINSLLGFAWDLRARLLTVED